MEFIHTFIENRERSTLNWLTLFASMNQQLRYDWQGRVFPWPVFMPEADGFISIIYSALEILGIFPVKQLLKVYLSQYSFFKSKYYPGLVRKLKNMV